MPIYTNNQGAPMLRKHPMAPIQSTHVDITHYFAWEKVSRKEVCFEYCSTDEMVADCFTKPLPEIKFRLCLSGMRVG